LAFRNSFQNRGASRDLYSLLSPLSSLFFAASRQKIGANGFAPLSSSHSITSSFVTSTLTRQRNGKHKKALKRSQNTPGRKACHERAISWKSNTRKLPVPGLQIKNKLKFINFRPPVDWKPYQRVFRGTGQGKREQVRALAVLFQAGSLKAVSFPVGSRRRRLGRQRLPTAKPLRPLESSLNADLRPVRDWSRRLNPPALTGG
jgi:hypothetical protein